MGKARTPPSDRYPKWSTARFWGFVRSKLRAGWVNWPPRYDALAAAKRNAEPGQRHKFEYQCAICKCWHKQKDVEVDHIIPIGSLKSLEELPVFVDRLFAPADKLRVVCKPCHLRLTAAAKRDSHE